MVPRWRLEKYNISITDLYISYLEIRYIILNITKRMSNFRRTGLWADFDSKWLSPLLRNIFLKASVRYHRTILIFFNSTSKCILSWTKTVFFADVGCNRQWFWSRSRGHHERSKSDVAPSQQRRFQPLQGMTCSSNFRLLCVLWMLCAFALTKMLYLDTHWN